MGKKFARRRDFDMALSKALGRKGIFRFFGLLSARRMVKHNLKVYDIDHISLTVSGRCYKTMPNRPWIREE